MNRIEAINAMLEGDMIVERKEGGIYKIFIDDKKVKVFTGMWVADARGDDILSSNEYEPNVKVMMETTTEAILDKLKRYRDTLRKTWPEKATEEEDHQHRMAKHDFEKHIDPLIEMLQKALTLASRAY